MSQRCCYQPRCYSDCCDQSSMEKCCSINRNRSCCDCCPTRLLPDVVSSEQTKKLKPKPATSNNAVSSNSNSVKTATKSNLKSRNAQSKAARAKSEGDSDGPISKKIDKCARDHMMAMDGKLSSNAAKQSETKHIKNKQNFQYQDMLGNKRMEVINEEDYDDDIDGYFDSEQSKKLQESCADFLAIVHDTVLDTVQKSVESMLRDYFVHTMEKIECLSSQMMRNECLLSKMYYDVIDKVAEQGEKSARQIKCIYQVLAEFRQDSNSKNNDAAGKYSSCPCTCPCCSLRLDEEMVASGKSRFKTNCNCNCKSGRDSDTETTKTLCSNTDTSIRSCDTSKATSKANVPDTSSTSINGEVERSTRRSHDYADYLIKEQRRQQADVAAACCGLEYCCKPVKVQKASRTSNDKSLDRRPPTCRCDNRHPSTKYISVQSGPSVTDLLSLPSPQNY